MGNGGKPQLYPVLVTTELSLDESVIAVFDEDLKRKHSFCIKVSRIGVKFASTMLSELVRYNSLA